MSAPRLLVAMSFAVLALIACGGGAVSPSGTAPTPQPAPAPPPPPSFYDGYFSTAKPSATALWDEGRTYVIVFSWDEDAAAAARTLQERRAFAFVSVHTCFHHGSLDLECYGKARAWMQPIVDTGRFLGLFGPDEPSLNGISPAETTAAVARFKADGYRTMVAEVWRWYVKARHEGAPLDYGADLYGLTAYDDKPEYVVDEHRLNPHLNVMFVSTAESDTSARSRAAQVGARGLIRWSLDMGAARHGRPVYLGEEN